VVANSFPNEPVLTFAGVSCVSAAFTPSLALSLWNVRTFVEGVSRASSASSASTARRIGLRTSLPWRANLKAFHFLAGFPGTRRPARRMHARRRVLGWPGDDDERTMLEGRVRTNFSDGN